MCYRSKVYLWSTPVCECLIQCSHRALNPSREKLPRAWRGASRTCEPVHCYRNSIIHRIAAVVAFLPPPLPRYTLFACEENTYEIRNKQSVKELWFLANEWLGTMASRVRKPRLFCETNSTPQRPIEPHEICVKKLLATMMITYYEFHKYYHLVKPQFIIKNWPHRK